MDPIHSVKMAKNALAVLEIPKSYTRILPSHRWRPPEEDVVNKD
jgi:hypothetical protein